MALDKFRRIDMQINRANDYQLETQFAKEGDYNGRELVVQITNGGEVSNQTGVSLNLGWHHNSVGNSGLDPFTAIDASKGIFKITYPTEMLNTGDVTATIQVIEDGKITLTRNFKITVEYSPIDENTIVSENSFTVLQNALSTISKYDGRIANLEANKVSRSEFDSRIDNLLDGSPSIFMNSLSELQTTYPNGTAGVALVNETNPAKIYIWNGSAWEDFGDYQGIAVKDGSVTSSKIADGSIERSKLSFSNRYFINASDKGFILVDTTAKTITVKGGADTYYFSNDSNILALPSDLIFDYSTSLNRTFGLYYNIVSKTLNSGIGDNMTKDDFFIASFWVDNAGKIVKINSQLPLTKFKVDNLVFEQSTSDISKFNFLTSTSRLDVDTSAKTVTLKSGFWFYENGFINSGANKVVNYANDVGAGGATIYMYYNRVSAVFSYYLSPENVKLTKDDIFVGNIWFGANGTSINKISSFMPDSNFYVNGLEYNKLSVTNPNAYDISNNRIVVSPEIYITEEETLPIYKSSILPVDSDAVKLSLKSTNGNKAVIKSFDYIDVKSEDLGNTGKIVARAKDVTNKFYSTSFDVNKISAASKTGATPKILMIGDSITNRQLANYLKLKLAEYSITSAMLGTIVSEGWQNAEGREGWLSSTFTGRSSRGVNAGKVTAQTAQGTSSITLNPFIRLATEADKTNFPDRCFRLSTTETYTERSYEEDTDKTGDFYIFDFENYMAVQGIEAPDIITIALGTNDISALGSGAINNAKESFDIMLDSIRTALPNVKIGIIPQPQTGDATRWKDSAVPFIEAIIKYVSDRADDNLFIVPVWMHQNREFIFNATTASVGVGESNEMVETLGDTIHFGADGRYQYADVLFAFVANKI